MRIGSEYYGGTQGTDGEASTHENPPAGIYQAVLAKVADVGTHSGRSPEDKDRHKVVVSFELVRDVVKAKDWRDSKGRRAVVFKDYNLSLFKKEDKPTAHFRILLDTVLPDLVEHMMKEEGDVDTSAWEGKPCLVTIESSGKFPKVKAVMASEEAGLKAEGKYDTPFGLWKYLLESAKVPPAK